MAMDQTPLFSAEDADRIGSILASYSVTVSLAPIKSGPRAGVMALKLTGGIAESTRTMRLARSNRTFCAECKGVFYASADVAETLAEQATAVAAALRDLGAAGFRIAGDK